MDFDATAFKGKMPWTKRAELIKEHFPKSANVEWSAIFRDDPHILGRVLGDVFKADMAEPGRPGKRPSLDPTLAASRLRRYENTEHTIKPFGEALRALQANRSLRHFARTTGLAKSTLDRIMKGESQPDLETIETVANNLGKDPAYFVEYRIGYITAVISHYLEWAPESSVVQYNKIKGHYASH